MNLIVEKRHEVSFIQLMVQVQEVWRAQLQLGGFSFHRGSHLRNGSPQNPSSPHTQGLKSVRHSIMFLTIRTTFHRNPVASCSKNNFLSLFGFPVKSNCCKLWDYLKLSEQLVTNAHICTVCYCTMGDNVNAFNGKVVAFFVPWIKCFRV